MSPADAVVTMRDWDAVDRRPDGSLLVGAADVAWFLKLPKSQVERLWQRQALPRPSAHAMGYRGNTQAEMQAAKLLHGSAAILNHLGASQSSWRRIARSLRGFGVKLWKGEMLTTGRELDAWQVTTGRSVCVAIGVSCTGDENTDDPPINGRIRE